MATLLLRDKFGRYHRVQANAYEATRFRTLEALKKHRDTEAKLTGRERPIAPAPHYVPDLDPFPLLPPATDVPVDDSEGRAIL